MEKQIFYDLQVEYADDVLTFFLPKNKYLGVFYNSFSIVNKKHLKYRIKDAFDEIERVVFFNLERAPINCKYPFEKVRDALMRPNVLTITWDATDEKLILDADKLCSPYQLRNTNKTIPKHFISANKLNEKAAFVKEHQRIYPSLELQSAYAGLSIPQKPVLRTQGENRKELISESMEDLIFYSTNRTINTYRLLQTNLYKNTVDTKQGIINTYDIDAKVDDTDAKLSSLVLTHNRKYQFQDYSGINFEIETDQGKINLLQHLYKQKIIPQAVFEFYQQVENKNYKNYSKALNHGTTTLVPYYNNDLQPTDCYANFSFGGNHGSISSQKLQTPFDNKISIDTVNKITKQFFNAYSIDADNCYPTANVKMKIFNNENCNDYEEMLKESISIKRSLPEHIKDWTDEDKNNSHKRLKLKRILNTATGAADVKHHSMLPLNNKIMSMRIIVNLIIYELGTQYTRKLNAKVISTNTDGIKIAFDTENIDEQTIFDIADEMSHKYGIHFSVKKIDRIIVKDTNNLIEWSKNQDNSYTVENVNGKLGKGYQGKVPLDGNLDHPIIVDMAVIDYLTNHDDISNITDASQYLKKFLEEHLENKKSFDGMQWALFVKPTDKMKYQYDNCEISKAGRFYFSKTGKTIHCTNAKGKVTKIRLWTSDKVKKINYKYEINKIADDIDIEPYYQWTMNVLKQWIHLQNTQPSIFESKPSKIKPTKELKLKSKDSVLAKFLKERSN